MHHDIAAGAPGYRVRALALEDPSDSTPPSMSIEELAAQLAKGEPITSRGPST